MTGLSKQWAKGIRDAARFYRLEGNQISRELLLTEIAAVLVEAAMFCPPGDPRLDVIEAGAVAMRNACAAFLAKPEAEA